MARDAHGKKSVPLEVDGKRNLIGLDFDELSAALAALGLEKFRTAQVWSWLYSRGARDFAAMTDLAKPAREKLAEHYVIARPSVSQHQKSKDGTQKWLLKMADGQEVECVHIPETDRGALCVSSQVGCTLTCRFCHTGTQRLVRSLDASEIVAQVMLAKDYLNEWDVPAQSRLRGACEAGVPQSSRARTKTGKPGGSPAVRLLTNIVMMGMGEPLFNYENVAKALRIVMRGDGIAIGKRRITLSTSGVVPLIERCGAELGVNLAISLHAVTDELRDQIMPINRKYPIKELLAACRAYPGASNARRITFEYVMLKGVNDSPADAKQLVRLLRGIPAKINLIPFNPWPGTPFECSERNVIEKFGDIVNAAGYASPIRATRGDDIMAACGQLKSASMKLSAAERAAIDRLIAEKDRAQGLSA
ncbi:MAG: 23S rRNA (adenine(2503)-C(2))-methyltransferase RlmN [Alphaproteobacteria bacterium]|nr:23S rRNA (adenine(2503)-C(2))-methyltransferase RlmN [Alphaproteobacteria bacterium]